ncbi:MAG: hypothetical protein DRG78_11725 [Epsilonproteobacteria bacterium]|nr:MAG: hypothetical protein DRG78_11725 [Campylobacterota bacterium]
MDNNKDEYLTYDEIKLIKEFANDIGFNTKQFHKMKQITHEKDSDKIIELDFSDIASLLLHFNSAKLDYIVNKPSTYEDYINANPNPTIVIKTINPTKYANMLNDLNIYSLIKFYNNDNESENAINAIRKVVENLKKKDFRKNEKLNTCDRCTYLALNPTVPKKSINDLYKELHKKIFIDRKIKRHKNVKKLKVLIEKIFEITLKDNEIKLNTKTLKS